GNDATNKNYVDNAITAAAADGSETIVTAGTDISVTGTGTTANPYIVNSTFTEVDGSTSNEIQNLGQVLTEGNDAGGSVITNMGTPVIGTDATTKDYVDTAITASNQTVVSADAGNLVVAGTDGGAFLNSVNDADADPTNEIQTAAQVAFTPTGNTTSTDVQAAIEEIQTEVDGFAAVAGQTNTASNAGTAGVGVFARKTGADLEFKNINSTSGKITVTDDTANDEIDLEIGANAITTNELANNAVTNIKLAANAVTTDKILDGTIVTTDIASGGNDKVLTTSATGVVTWEDKTALDTDATNEIQNINEVLADGNDAGGLAIANIANPTNAQDAATKDYVDTAITASNQTVVSADAGNIVVAGTDGGAFLNSVNDADADATNEIQNINEVLADGNNAGGLVIDNIGAPIDGNDATNKNYVDNAITAAAADGSETIVTAGTDISVTGTGTTANPYIVNSTFTEVDGSTTNEIQNSAQVNLSTPLDVDGDTVNETTVQEAIADLSTAVAADGDTDATNEIQNINEVLADGNNAGGLVIDNIGAPIDGNDATNKNYVDNAITAAAADGSETIVTAGTDISVTGTGTTANPYIVNSTFTEVDGSTSNEIQNLGQVLTEGNDAGGSVITNMGTPVIGTDATTKDYVDTAITASN
ncbi:beta strand repeat-containing protein, partial [Aquimarina intermedia]|uniref:beta strand repeat-containing protein n=1 Tax=Aquimarina intermedia TaxID=350814 RepID=UPI0014781395